MKQGKPILLLRLLVGGLVLAALGPGTVFAHSKDATPGGGEAHAGHHGHYGHHGGQHGAHHHEPEERPAEAVTIRFADVPLLDHNGRTVRLESDVIGDRIVVMDFVYTSCTTVCPIVTAIMLQAQKQLGDRIGEDLRLVSMTVDPVRDTPSRLREYAQARGAGPDWVWVTGSVPAVNDTLRGFGTWTPNFEDHPVVMMVGDGRTGTWTRFYGFTDASELVAKVEELIEAREAMAASQHSTR